MTAQVGLLGVLLDEVAVAARPHLPVEVLERIAGHVGAVLGELDAEAVKGRAVHAGDEAFDHEPRAHVEVGKPRHHRGIEAAAGLRGAGAANPRFRLAPDPARVPRRSRAHRIGDPRHDHRDVVRGFGLAHEAAHLVEDARDRLLAAEPGGQLAQQREQALLAIELARGLAASLTPSV